MTNEEVKSKLEIIKLDFKSHYASRDTLDVFDMAIKALDQQKKTRWIPVSERLPEETGWYIVTFRVYGGGYAVCELSYRKPENYWTDKDIFKKALSNDEILAWMPLPERYKDGE